MSHLNALVPYLPVLALWCAVCCLAILTLRELGFGCLKKYPVTALVLILSLGSFPVGGLYKLSRPYQGRILALFRRYKSPAVMGRCPFFPPDNIWNRRVQDAPLDPSSQAYIATMGPGDRLHADFGAQGGYQFAVTDGSDPDAQMTFGGGAPNSDQGPYRIPDDAPIEEGEDKHVLVLNSGECVLYELYGAAHSGSHQWFAESAAIFDLRSNKLRPAGWTSADAAGLPMVPGLARYEEVQSGHIGHALRFSTRRTRRAYVWPGRHFASQSTDPALPPMGQRFRLRAEVDISQFSPETRVILTALKEYGMMLADNGGNWFISGSHDVRWPSRLPGELATLHGSDFEAVDVSRLMVDSDSGQARQ